MIFVDVVLGKGPVLAVFLLRVEMVRSRSGEKAQTNWKMEEKEVLLPMVRILMLVQVQ